MKEVAITKAFVKMMAAFATMVGKDPMIVLVNELNYCTFEAGSACICKK
jgi:hypothetical protein